MAEQKIKSLNLLEDLELSPEYLREFYTTDFFQRTLSHLFGLYENKWKALRATANGELIVYQAQAMIEKYDVISVTAEDFESVPFLFNFPEGVNVTKVIEVHVLDNPVLIRFIPYDETVLGQIYHEAGGVYIRAASFKGFTVQNAITGAYAKVTVVGWY